MWRTFLSRLLLPCQSPNFVPLIVLLSLMVNHVSAYLRFVMLSSDFFYMWRVIGICNTCFSVMLLVWCIWDKQGHATLTDHDCSTQKIFWEENFTGKKDLFHSVNMKNCGRRKVRKHKEIKGSDKIFTLNVSAKFDSMNKTETTYSEREENWGDQERGWERLWLSRPK